MTDQFLHVPLAEITASLTNPRTSFNEQTLAELAEDIKVRGVDTPITLRPLPGARAPDTDRDVCYEIVFGERRYRASVLAGVPTIPARVRDLTDAQALVAQLVENLGREDITALEEAEGIRRLMDAEQLNADQVAERLKKSRRHVYNRLKLLDLGTEGKEALRTGKIDASRALLLASVPNSKLQIKALKYAAEPHSYTHELPSVRHLQDWLRQNVMLDLKHSVFKITDARLVEAAGSCKDCSKRTGADPDLFSHVGSADMCTDPPCFHKKGEAHHAQLLKKAEAKGMRVVEGKEALELLGGNNWRTSPADYLRLDEQRPDLSQEGERPTTLGQALGKDAPAPILFIHPKTQEAMELVPEEEAEALLLAKGLIKSAEAAPERRGKDPQAELQDLKKEIERETARTTHDQLYNATLSAIHTSTAAAAKALLTGDALRAWLLAELDVHHAEDMAEAIGLELKDGVDETDAVAQRIQRLGESELLRAVAGHMLSADRYFSHHTTAPLLSAYAKMLAVDAKTAKRWATGIVKDKFAAQLKALEDRIAAKKPPATDAPAAQATRGAGAKPKNPPARAAKTSPEEAKRGIAAAMQGLEGAASAPKGAVAPPAAPTGASEIRYRGPNGEAWTGRGLMPRWLRVLVDAGQAKEAFEVPREAPRTGTDKTEERDLYNRAVGLVTREQKATVRLLKDELGVGTTKALELMASLEAAGKVSPAAERGARKVLVPA